MKCVHYLQQSAMCFPVVLLFIVVTVSQYDLCFQVCDRILDLALIVDRSGSIHERFAWNVAFNEYGYGWKLLTSFLVNLMYRLHIGPTQTRVRKFIIVRLPIFLNTKLTYPLNYFIIRYKYTLF